VPGDLGPSLPDRPGLPSGPTGPALAGRSPALGFRTQANRDRCGEEQKVKPTQKAILSPLVSLLSLLTRATSFIAICSAPRIINQQQLHCRARGGLTSNPTQRRLLLLGQKETNKKSRRELVTDLGNASSHPSLLIGLLPRPACRGRLEDHRGAFENPARLRRIVRTGGESNQLLLFAIIQSCFRFTTASANLTAHATGLSINPGSIIVAGGSARGGLAAGITLLTLDRNGPVIAGQLLLAPMLDDRDATTSTQQFDGSGCGTAPSKVAGCSALLGERRGTPGVSIYAAPARATDLSHLPPTYVDVASAEVFRDECVELASVLWREGGTAELLPPTHYGCPGPGTYAPSGPPGNVRNRGNRSRSHGLRTYPGTAYLIRFAQACSVRSPWVRLALVRLKLSAEC
jgi:hypothetical protein